jgi:hypothetical protein
MQTRRRNTEDSARNSVLGLLITISDSIFELFKLLILLLIERASTTRKFLLSLQDVASRRVSWQLRRRHVHVGAGQRQREEEQGESFKS